MEELHGEVVKGRERRTQEGRGEKGGDSKRGGVYPRSLCKEKILYTVVLELCDKWTGWTRAELEGPTACQRSVCLLRIQSLYWLLRLVDVGLRHWPCLRIEFIP